MKKTLLLLMLMPVMAAAQTTEKVLYMSVKRTAGTKTIALSEAEDCLGPVLNMSTNRLQVGTASILRTNVKEIRFEVREEEVADAIEDIDATDADDSRIYDLQGRELKSASRAHIYIMNGKKYLKK